MKIRIVPYKRGSTSASALRDALREQGVNCKIVQRDSRTYNPRASHYILNWGCTDWPSWEYIDGQLGANSPVFTKQASNKLEAFTCFKNAKVCTPEWTVNKNEAIQWLENGGSVVCRTILNGTNGNGIVLASTLEELVDAPLYVKYKKKKIEWRIHVFNGEVIDVQQKRKRAGVESNGQIRNLSNGWVFCRENVEVQEEAKQEAIKAVASLGLVFGAVDIIYNAHENKSFVLEVNSAPGLEGSTIVSYANAIKSFLENK